MVTRQKYIAWAKELILEDGSTSTNSEPNVHNIIIMTNSSDGSASTSRVAACTNKCELGMYLRSFRSFRNGARQRTREWSIPYVSGLASKSSAPIGTRRP